MTLLFIIYLFSIGWDIISLDVIDQPLAEEINQSIRDGSTSFHFSDLLHGSGDQIFVDLLLE